MTMLPAYENYFQTKHYDERYPRPNRSTLARVRRMATPGNVLLDIGAGNGRYAIPLAEAGYRVIAVERSDAARDQLLSRLTTHRLRAGITCFKDLEDVDDKDIGECRLSLLLFGVLGHMDFGERAATLDRLGRCMNVRPQILGSVPNRLRRFRYEQANTRVQDKGPAPRFAYTRHFGGSANTFEYTAFSPAELAAEFSLHGWRCRKLIAESILSESAVTRIPMIGMADAVACRALPAQTGYDIFFHTEYAG